MDRAIDRLAVLPAFLKLQGRPAVVAGGGAAAAWKAELLAAAGAEVRIFATEPEAKLAEFAASGRAHLARRAWRPDDLIGAALAVLESADDAEAAAFRAAARAAGALVNVIDRPEFCDFAFGSIVNRSPLIIGISTDGAAPVFGQAIRARIEAMLPASLAAWGLAARDWRARLKPLAFDFSARRGFWERFATLALSAARPPEASDFEALAAGGGPSAGEIALIGAGPGDPALITLKAVAALQSADVVLYDKLVNPKLLELARREAERRDVGKRAGEASMQQRDIAGLAVELALQGKRVVRLKGGDPNVFGRANEEIAAARAANVKLTIVPGVTTAFAAAAELGLSLTDRDKAMRLQFATAHDGEGELSARLSWAALAAADATTAIYMGKRRLGEIVARLIAEGVDKATPAVYAVNVGLAGAVYLRAPLADLPAKVGAQAPDGPALLLYGAALAQGDEA